MGIEIQVDSLEDMCDLMCYNKIPEGRSRMNIEEAHLIKEDRELIELLEEIRRILNVSYEVDAPIHMTFKKMLEIYSKYGYTLKKN